MSQYRSEEKVNFLRPMIVFHNLVKENEVYKSLAGAEHILELGAGHLNDLMRWYRQGIRNVTAVEIDEDSIQRGMEFYKNLSKKYPDLPRVTYIHANLARDDIRAKLPTKYDGIVSNFSFHYFLQDKKSLDNIIKIIKFAAKNTGCRLFITGLDGGKVRDRLIKFPRIDFRMKSGQIAAYIRRQFDPAINPAITGQKISVFLASIGIEHPEYLMYADLLAKKIGGLKYVKSFAEFMPLYLNRRIDRALYQYSQLNMLMCFDIS